MEPDAFLECEVCGEPAEVEYQDSREIAPLELRSRRYARWTGEGDIHYRCRRHAEESEDLRL